MKAYTKIECFFHKYSKGIFVLSLCITMCMIYRNIVLFTPFIDYSYQVENAYRICNGFLPYRDYILVTAPGTYFLLALFLKIFGYSNLGCIALIVVNQIIGLWLIYKIVTFLCDSAILITIIMGACAFSGFVFFPFPHYNHLCTIMKLAAIYFVVLHENKAHNRWALFASGFCACLSMCFKQNYGFFFMVALVIWAIFKIVRKDRDYCFIPAGILAVAILGVVYIVLTGTPISNIWFDMFEFPAGSRSVLSSYKDVLKLLFTYYYGSIAFVTLGIVLLVFAIKNNFVRFILSLSIIPIWLGWTYWITPYSSICAWYFLTLTAIFCLFYSIIVEKKGLYEKNVLIICFLVYVAGRCSQVMDGSPYMFALAVVFLYQFYRKQFSVFAVLFFSLSYMFISCYFAFRVPDLCGYRLDNIMGVNDISNRYYGLHADASIIEDLNEITEYVENVVQDSSFVEFPGEDPIYWGTSTTPQLDFFQMHPQTCPYSIEDIEKKVCDCGIEYVIIKTAIAEGVWMYNPSDVLQIVNSFKECGYYEFESLDHYVVLKRK